MKKHPFLFILLLVFLSMFFAVIYHSQFSIITFKTGRLFRKVASIPMEQIEALSNSEKCELTEKNKTLAEVPSYFRERRSSTQAEFPRSCVAYIIKTSDAVVRSSVNCNSSSVCINDEYVNLIYNLYTDVMSCLDIPQAESLPWFMLKSGFYLNAKNGISGIDTHDFNLQSLKEVLAQIKQQQQFNCQRLYAYAQKFNFYEKNDCLFIKSPENPLLGFLIFATRYLEIKRTLIEEAQATKNHQDGKDQINDKESDSDRILHLRILQKMDQSQHSDFINAIKQLSNKINTDMKEGVCLPETQFSF